MPLLSKILIHYGDRIMNTDDVYPTGTLIRYAPEGAAVMAVKQVELDAGGEGNHRYTGGPLNPSQPDVTAFHNDCSLANQVDQKLWQSYYD
jgi:hypothetical protein